MSKYFSDVKVLLSILMLACLGVWIFKQDADLFSLVKDLAIAIISLATGRALGTHDGGTDKNP